MWVHLVKFDPMSWVYTDRERLIGGHPTRGYVEKVGPFGIIEADGGQVIGHSEHDEPEIIVTLGDGYWCSEDEQSWDGFYITNTAVWPQALQPLELLPRHPWDG